jgi:hypothetical protein
MNTSALLALQGTRMGRDEALEFLLEGAKRRLLDETAQLKLIEMLDAKDRDRTEREADRRFRSLHGGLTRAQLEQLEGGGR